MLNDFDKQPIVQILRNSEESEEDEVTSPSKISKEATK